MYKLKHITRLPVYANDETLLLENYVRNINAQIVPDTNKECQI